MKDMVYDSYGSFTFFWDDNTVISMSVAFGIIRENDNIQATSAELKELTISRASNEDVCIKTYKADNRKFFDRVKKLCPKLDALIWLYLDPLKFLPDS